MPGAQVTAVYEGKGLTSLFLADPAGEVFTVRGSISAGWSQWQSVAQGTTTPGAPISAFGFAGGGYLLFVADPGGGVFRSAGSRGDGWASWQRVLQGSTTAGGHVGLCAELMFARGSFPWFRDYRGITGSFLALVADPSGGVFGSEGNPPTWGSWESVSDGQTLPGAPITAVGAYDSFVSMFLADQSGNVLNTRGKIGVGWRTWKPVSDGVTAPGAPIGAVLDGNAFRIFVADPHGGVYTARGRYDTGWGQWQSVSDGSTTPGAPVTALIDTDGNVTLFLADRGGGVYTTTESP